MQDGAFHVAVVMMAIASSATMVTTIAMMPTFQPFASRLKDASVTPVDALGMMMPAFCKPRNAMNRPMPAGIATANRLRNRLEDGACADP